MPVQPPRDEVEKVFANYPVPHREQLLTVRKLIFDVANSIEDVGELDETLKWGEPSYLTPKSKTGTTIRIDWKPRYPDYYAMYFNCRTNLVERFRKEYPDDFEFDGNRAIRFAVDEPIPIRPLSCCIAAALTYHRDKRRSASP